MLIDKSSTASVSTPSTHYHSLSISSSTNQEGEREGSRATRSSGVVVCCNNGCVLVISFFAAAIISILMDAFMNQSLEQIQKETVQIQNLDHLGSFYQEIFEKHHNETINYTEVGQLLQDGANKLYRMAKDDYNYAANLEEWKQNLTSVIEAEEQSFEEYMHRAREDLEAGRKHIHEGNRLERTVDLYFCAYVSSFTCKIIGGTSKVGRAVQLYDWGEGNITQGRAEKDRSDHELKKAQQILKQKQGNQKLVDTYDLMENSLNDFAKRDQEHADQEWKDSIHNFDEAKRENGLADEFEALAGTAYDERDTALGRKAACEIKVTVYALLAVTLGLLLVPLFLASSVHAKVASMAWKHSIGYYNNLPVSMQQNIITNTICHSLIFLLVLGLKQDTLIHINDYDSVERGEIITSFAVSAAAIETALFSLLSFSHTALSLNETTTGSMFSASSFSCKKFILQGMFLLLIFVIQVLILICIYVIQMLIFLIACGQPTILVTIVQFMSHWSFLAMIVLILMAMSRLWSPMDFQINFDAWSGMGGTLFTVSESTFLVRAADERATPVSSVTCSIEEGSNVSPLCNHDDNMTWLSFDTWSTISLLPSDSFLSTFVLNEFTWLKGEIYMLCLCLQILLLSCVLVVIMNCFPHVALWQKWAIFVTLFPITVWQVWSVLWKK